MNPPADSGPELRRDPLSGEWVIVSPGRGYRPHSAAGPSPAQGSREEQAACPFCPGNESETPPALLTLPEAGSGEPWSVRVVPNRFPAVSPEGQGATGSEPLFRSKPARGFHEVIVETPRHDQEAPARRPAQVRLMIEAYRQRLAALMARPEIAYVVVFKNRGLAAGTSLDHPHSQVVALSQVPGEVRRRVQTARRHYRRTGRCLVCDLVAAERKDGRRLIFEADGFLAYAPFAAAAPYETLLVPLEHGAALTAASPATERGLATSLQSLLRKLDRTLDVPPFNLILRTAPKPWLTDPALHWYAQLVPRLSRAAGFELGSGVRINMVAPEAAARRLAAG